MKYETIIGLEIHAQLQTRTKLFCRCSTEFGQRPNTLTCPVCLGLPGSLPVINAEAVKMAIKLALAINARLNLKSIYSRKNYFYPDLPKGYQITQYHLPIAEDGYLEIEIDGRKRTIGIERINLEEDAGKSIHDGQHDSDRRTYLDFNRCGVPLLEIVGRPDLRSAEEAVEFVQSLRTLLQYLEICDGNMEEGNLRCDANISVRPVGSAAFGTKTEVKNLNSFRFLARALEYEASRHIELIERGERVIQETRGWDSTENRTVPQRTKEEAHDYRYFPEPDLPPLVLDQQLIEQVAGQMPELPKAKQERFIRDYNLPAYDARILTGSRALADYFEATARASGSPKQASNWIMREVLQYLKENDLTIEKFPVRPEHLGSLIKLTETQVITMTIAKEKVFPEMIASGKSPEAIIDEKGLKSITDEVSLKKIIEEVIQNNPGPVKQYLEGKAQVVGFLLGQVMKASKGKANPQKAQELLKSALDNLKK